MITVNNFHGLQLNRKLCEPRVNVPQAKSVKIIAKLRWTIRPFKTYTSKEYLQVFKNSFIAVEAKIIRVTFVRSHV